MTRDFTAPAEGAEGCELIRSRDVRSYVEILEGEAV
jgi:hypothetical protein